VRRKLTIFIAGHNGYGWQSERRKFNAYTTYLVNFTNNSLFLYF